jgi:acetylornithine deacetylase
MREAVVTTLERYVAHATVSSEPVLPLAADLASRAEDLGFRVERFVDPDKEGKCSVVASIGPSGTDGLAISGHMDVVPVAGQPWTSDPFVATETNGRLVGRGTADMKGFLAAVMTALGRIPASAYRKELVLVWTHDEEIGCLGSAGLTGWWGARPMPTTCWIGEPTSFQVHRMHPGHVAIELVALGKAAHSSRPELGINAIEAAAEVVGAARELAKDLGLRPAEGLPEMERPWVALNVGEIAGGSAVNIVPDRCVVRIGYRPLPGEPELGVWEELQRRIAVLGLSAAVEGRVLRMTPALLTARRTPLEAVLLAHAETQAIGASTFATDGGNLSKLGTRPLVFGPGSIAVAHQADEWIAIDELVKAVDVVEAVVRATCC